MEFLAITDEGESATTSFRDYYGLELPLYAEGGEVHREYEQEIPFATGAYPQEWIIGTDGRIVYVNNTFEVEAVTAVLDEQLAK